MVLISRWTLLHMSFKSTNKVELQGMYEKQTFVPVSINAKLGYDYKTWRSIAHLL